MTRSPVAREVYRTSRMLDFASERELTAQIGHPRGQWLEVVLKELMDNALDAAEEAGVPPVVSVRVDGRVLEVADEGPGLPGDVIADVLDFSVRVSSREAYVGPSRGAQGNALKTIVCMPFALDRKAGLIEIEVRDWLHRITFAVDPIEQAPVAHHEILPSPCTGGTTIRVHWPEPVDDTTPLVRLIIDFAMLNPHLRVDFDLGDDETGRFAATDPGWTRWRPSDPEPATWYDLERLERRIAAAIHHDRTNGGAMRTVRAFVSTFQGLSSTARQKELLDRLGMRRASLDEAFVTPAGEIDHDAANRLLFALQAYARPIKPRNFGETGASHLQRRAGDRVFAHKRIEIEAPAEPLLCEAALIVLGNDTARSVTVGINNSPALAGGDAYPDLWRVLERAGVAADDPVWFHMHLAGPRLPFADRGKARLLLGYGARWQIEQALSAMLEPWRKYKKRRDREQKADRRSEALPKPERPPTLIEAAERVIPGAYLKASDNGALKVKPRQIGYAARDEIQELTGRALDLKYFTQNLFNAFVRTHPELTKDWDITWDARGTFVEPHTGNEIPIGTSEVRSYMGGWCSHFVGGENSTGWWKTSGPSDRFGAVLFVEKEGFRPLLEQVRLAERFDLALMSTKGLSTTAARELVDHLTGIGVPVYVIRDFDVSGFNIAGTLARDTDRYAWTTAGAIDLGLRLDDVKAEGLASERVFYEVQESKKEKKKRVLDPDNPSDREKILAKIANQLGTNGATEDEIEFLVRDRVELNAFTSRGLVDWFERKLKAAGIRKVVPASETLTEAAAGYAREAVMARIVAEQQALIEREAQETIRGLDLEGEVRRLIGTAPELSWDGAVRRLVNRGSAL